MLLPVLLAFLISNSASSRTIYNGMKCLFWLVASLYLWEVMPQISAPAELLTIDFFESYSPLESSALAPHFYGLLLYFTFCSSSKGYFILAALGNILAFKRVNVLAALGLLLMGKFPYHRKKVPDWLKEGTILFFILLTLVEYQLLKRPEALTELADRLGFPLVKGLLMGRNEFVETLLSAGFVSSGFGSTGPALEQLLGKKGLELDLMQVALELGPVGVIALVNLIWRGIGKSLAEYLILLLLFFNMASSYQLTDSYGMLYNFLCLFLLQREVKGGYE